MQENLFLVVNPKSGTGKIKSELLKVCNTLTRGGYSVTVYPTSKKGDATAAVANLGSNYSTIVCCGGDGTLNEVITGVQQNKNNYNIGYIPSGTLNEWSSGLKISKNIATAAADVISGRREALDIGKFGPNNYFCYTASFGAFTQASYSAPQDVKNVIGQLAYVLEGVKSLGNIKPIHLKIQSDTDIYEGDYLFGAVSNSMSVGGIIKLHNAGVVLNDGLFEVVLIENPDSLADLNAIIDAIATKKFNRKCIKQFKTSKLIVESGRKTDWTLDGEHVVADRITEITNLNKAVNFIIP